ncbi:MAG: hypothetical protein ACREJD_09335 [Phycisphaerales bacterium]
MRQKVVRVRMVKTAAGPRGTFMAGQSYTLDEKTAKAFLADGAAIVDTDIRETAEADHSDVEDRTEEEDAGEENKKGNSKK